MLNNNQREDTHITIQINKILSLFQKTVRKRNGRGATSLTSHSEDIICKLDYVTTTISFM